MRLISAVLGFSVRKAVVFAALVLSMFLTYLLIQALVPALHEAASDRDRLQRVRAERAAIEEDLQQLRRTAARDQRLEIDSLEKQIEDAIADGRRQVREQEAEVAQRREERQEVCGVIARLIEWVRDGKVCEAAERAVQMAEEGLETLRGTLAHDKQAAVILDDASLSPREKLNRLGERGVGSPVEREIESQEAQLRQTKAEEERLVEAQASPAGWVVNQWAQSWKWLAGIAALILLLPLILRVISYFVLMPMVSRLHKPIHLAAGSENATADLRTGAAQRTLTIELGEDEVLSARSEHVRPVQGRIRSQLLYEWASPFISFAAGLYGLSRITGDERVTSAVLATPDDPDSYLMRIDFTDHPGLVMHPKHVVGVIGAPALKTRWRWGVLSFARWQVRYIMFAGTGSLIVQGSGDVGETSPQGRSTRMEQHLVMGFDSRLSVGVNRTEAFWPYLWGRTPLVADEFTGHHPFFWQKSSADGPSNPITRRFDALFSGLGKLLGF